MDTDADPNRIYTEELVAEIRESANAGNQLAQKIVKLLDLCRKNPLMQVTRRVLEGKVGEWRQRARLSEIT